MPLVSRAGVLRSVAALMLPFMLPSACTDPVLPEELADTIDTKPADESAGWTTRRLEAPARTSVIDASGAWVATFTDGARTVRMRGPERTFREAGVEATVTTRDWVRLLDVPFDGRVDREWLEVALSDRGPDLLATAMSYTTGGARDASYGPIIDGVRKDGSDFHDYLGIPWRFPTGTFVAFEPARARSLDCSGFQRMVFGYHGGLELVLAPRADRSALPRRAHDLFTSAPGVMVIEHRGVQVTDFEVLGAGDLVFQDADDTDGGEIDHVGMYLGVDDDGHHRFVSSRKSTDGPTMGDGGTTRSILDGGWYFARSFRAARRL